MIGLYIFVNIFQESSNRKVIIVGGGVAGMTTAVMLSDISGLSVTILEAESKLGGIFRTPFTAPGFYHPASRQDMGALDSLIGNTTIVDDFYTDLNKAIKIFKLAESSSVITFFRLDAIYPVELKNTACFH